MSLEADEVRLRKALRDLVALSALPAAWVGRDPPAIAAGLADVLVGSLYLDFVFVRLCDPDGGEAVEIARGTAWPAFPEWLRQYVAANGRLSRREIVRDIGDGTQRGGGIVLPVGVDGKGGLVAAACNRADFPSELDQLRLSVAANHAATTFRMARLVHDHRRAEEALRESGRRLRKAHDELETKVAERTSELRRSEAKIRRLVDANIIGIFFFAADGRIIEANDAFLQIVGYSREDLASGRLRWLDLTPPEWLARDEQQWIPMLQTTGILQPFEKEYFRKNGSRVPVLTGVATFDEAEHQGITFVLDLTESKRAEETLRDVEMELAHANRVATMGQLTASVAHEVSQPITATILNAQAALRWLDAAPPALEDVRQMLDRIVKDGHRARDVIDRIRALIKKAPPRKDRLDINEAIREVIDVTRGEVMKNGASVQTDLADDLPLIEGDRVQLQQVILNLIINAIEAMNGVSDGPRALLISTGTAEGGGVFVAVQDTGPVLDSAKLERLFEAFYTTKPNGLGMGLSICRSIIEVHGGRLWASANTPSGAIFQFALPCDAMGGQPEQPVSSVATTTGRIRG
jgi:PAS domain S-box-containing protein